MAMVLHEDHRPICSNNSNSGGATAATGGTRSSKKNKQRKTPQRGMGVAQLEELRIREAQQKTSSSSNPSSSLALPPIQQQPSLSFLGPASDPYTLSRSSLPIPSNAIDFFSPHPSNGNSGRGFLTMPYNDQCPPDPDGAGARKYNILTSFQNDPPNPGGWRPPPLQQRRQHHSQILMASNRSLPSGSGVNLQREPPSNQSYESNYHIPLSWPEEDKIVGIKRPWPFNPDSFSGHSAGPCRVPAFRESSSSSSTNHSEWRSHTLHRDKINKGNGVGDDGFLTLGHQVPSIPRAKNPFPPLHPHEYQSVEFPSSQVSSDDGLYQSGVASERPFYSFLPMGPDIHETACHQQQDEALESVDLKLKL